jgi:hypothetical protein
MATLLSVIAEDCIALHPEISLKDFHDKESMPSIGYCSGSVMNAIREQAILRGSTEWGRCIGEATADDDLPRAQQYVQFAQLHAESVHEAHAQLFMVVLAHEVKRLLLAAPAPAMR